MKAETLVGAVLVLFSLSMIVTSIVILYITGGWLLIGIGVAFIAGLMWWITRQARNY